MIFAECNSSLSKGISQPPSFLTALSQAAVSTDKARHLEQLFVDLTNDVQRNVDAVNRERFMTNLTNFRVDLKSFLDLNAFYKAIIHYTKE